ncbi:hypothetical protein DENSPDRAFT_877957 [Dentipellis sp. KUC8613]|nr:hypothetical protein DENSPDRAFT_877957 [Dentipellis sp. KUC8613]
MDSNAFVSLAMMHMPASSRLLPSACCPDKDLVVVVSRLGGKDRISLWKMQGSKKWEIDVDSGSGHNERIVNVAWSPDGQTVVLVHDPPRITLHNIQNGREERRACPILPLDSGTHFTDVWWFPANEQKKTTSIPDVFQRGNNIPGSAHSILKLLPILDPARDDSQVLTATDLFAFNGTHAQPASALNVPKSIANWPSLPPDPLSASIQPSPSMRGGEQASRPGEELDETDDSNVNSILAVSDSAGRLHCFLDGSCPLGAVPLASGSPIQTLYKDPDGPTFFAHARRQYGTSLQPLVIQLPLLNGRLPQDVARLSTTARELLWYAIRVIDDMRSAWCGSDKEAGARHFGIRWLQALQSLEAGSPTEKAGWSVVDLILLLMSGRSTEAVSDFIGSGEQMSERGLQKWESTVTEALIMLRDYSEKRVAPAFQRLHIVLEEMLGWSQLPQFAICELSKDDVAQSLELVGRAIISTSWLSAVARRELSRFKEFMKWLRFEIMSANPSPETNLQLRHDMLEVSSYVTSGLVCSQLDGWFSLEDAIPDFSPRKFGEAQDDPDLFAAMERACRVMQQRAPRPRRMKGDVNNVHKNIGALVQALGKRCEQIFLRATGATARSAHILYDDRSSQTERRLPALPPSAPILYVRERTTVDQNELTHSTQHLAIRVSSPDDRVCLCLVKLRYKREACSQPDHLGIAVLEDRLQGDGDQAVQFDLLNVDFFDDDDLVVVLRPLNDSKKTYVATVEYASLSYQTVEAEEYVREVSREELVGDALRRWQDGQLTSVPMPIKRSRALAAGEGGEVSLAVNGRAGRRVACVLDEEGLVLEALDLEGEEGEETDEEA